MTTVKEFCGVNSLYKFPDGSEITHEQMFGKVVNAIGLDKLTPLIPATKEGIIKALATDEHLNNIPLRLWDSKAEVVKILMVRAGINSISLSDCVCTLKHAARMWAEQESK